MHARQPVEARIFTTVYGALPRLPVSWTVRGRDTIFYLNDRAGKFEGSIISTDHFRYSAVLLSTEKARRIVNASFIDSESLPPLLRNSLTSLEACAFFSFSSKKLLPTYSLPQLVPSPCNHSTRKHAFSISVRFFAPSALISESRCGVSTRARYCSEVRRRWDSSSLHSRSISREA